MGIISKINSDIDKIRDIVLKFAYNFAKNTNALNHEEKISTNSLKYFSNISNSVEFKKMEDILINKFSQIENSINTQIMIWSQIFYIKKDILQVISVIFRFMMINSIYTMIDATICLYKWSKLLNKIYIEKLCIVEYKKNDY